MKRSLLVCTLCTMYTCLFAQLPHFEALTVEQGLSQNTVNCILKDHKGYLWVGTNDGLNRYDGYAFTVYRHRSDDTTSISDNKVYALLEDASGRIWVGTRHGLSIYDRSTDRFERHFHEAGITASLSHNFVRTLMEDDAHNIWVGTLGGGLNKWNARTRQFVRIPIGASTTWRNISDLLQDRHGHIWVVGSASELLRIHPETHQQRRFPFTSSDMASFPEVGKSLYQDEGGTLWIGTQGYGLLRFMPETESFDHMHSANSLLTNDLVKDVIEDGEGRLWIATDGGGLNVYDPSGKEVEVWRASIHRTTSLSSDAVYSLYRDDEGIMWVGTFDGGISILNPNRKPFHHMTVHPEAGKGLSHRSVLCFLEDQQGTLWIGTDGGGISLLDSSRTRYQYLRAEGTGKVLNSKAITSLLQDEAGKVWVGSYMGGLQQFNQQRQLIHSYLHEPENPHSLRNNNVWTLCEDRKGRLWVGTLGGLERLERKQQRFVHIRTQNAEGNSYQERVTTLYEDPQGTLWVGGKGLRYLDEGTQSLRYCAGEVGEVIRSLDVRVMYEDTYGNFWVGTEGGGLLLLDRGSGQGQFYTMADGLPSNAIHRILADANGQLWLSTNHGIMRFQPGGLLPTDVKQPLHFRSYCKQDGLQSNQFSYGAALKARDGSLFFGGINGFNYFHPPSIQDNPFRPPVELTGLRIYDQVIQPGTEGAPITTQLGELSELTLSYEQARMFTLEFTALNFTSSEKNTYAYKLEGFMDAWSFIGSRRQATFTNLDHGTYTFRVKASNNDGIWNEAGSSLRLTILPPWWKTKLAYACYGLLFLLILMASRHVLLIRERMRNALKIKEIEKQKVEEVNRMKLAFFTNVSHEFRTPLTLIKAPVEHLLQTYQLPHEIRQQLLLIQRNSQRMLSLVNQLLDFRKIEQDKMELVCSHQDVVELARNVKTAFDAFARQHHIDYRFCSEVDSLYTDVDTDKLEKILYNLLSNAFKFTPDKGQIQLIIHTLSAGTVSEGTVSAGTVSAGTVSEGTVSEGTVSEGVEGVPGAVVFSVVDSGIGISPERQARIFDRFYQITPNNRLRSHLQRQGSGIGLSYTRELVELHGGRISLESEEGKGSTFIVHLPLKGVEPQQATGLASNTHERALYHFLSDADNPLQDFPEQLLSTAPSREASAQKPSLLIVEDDAAVRDFLRLSFAEQFHILQAADGEEGLARAVASVPDAIISDVMMPRMDGITLCRSLKEDVRTSHVPVLLLTANTQEEKWLAGLAIGADDYVMKPFNLRILKARIDNLVQNRRALREKFGQQLPHLSASRLESADTEFMKRAISLVEEHMEDPEFGVNQFAKAMGMSRSVLYRKFNALTDQSVKEFINVLRLKRAAHMIRLSPDQSVAEVAYAVGFNDAQYFSKKFKKYYQCPPSQYGQQQAEQVVSEAKS